MADNGRRVDERRTNGARRVDRGGTADGQRTAYGGRTDGGRWTAGGQTADVQTAGGQTANTDAILAIVFSFCDRRQSANIAHMYMHLYTHTSIDIYMYINLLEDKL